MTGLSDITALIKERDEAVAEAKSLRATFDLRWKAGMRAKSRWAAATGRTMEWPDLADLEVWLMDRLEAVEAERDHWRANHDAQVQRNAVLRERPDLPSDRIPSIARYEAELSELRKTLDAERAQHRRRIEAIEFHERDIEAALELKEDEDAIAAIKRLKQERGVLIKEMDLLGTKYIALQKKLEDLRKWIK